MQLSLYLLIVLTTALPAAKGQDTKCHNRLDIAVAVDVSSSETTAELESVKSEVKNILSGLELGKQAVQVALIEISSKPKVLADFAAFSLAAVDRLQFSSDPAADVPAALRLAKDSVFNRARSVKTSKVLILVKDRRHFRDDAPDSGVLERMKTEASALRSTGVALHAVGVAGLWDRLELEALYGSDYLLFKGKSKAFEAAKSLNNTVCRPHCPQSGKSVKKIGQCYGSARHVVTSKAALVDFVDGLLKCRKEITRGFEDCSTTQHCNTAYRNISTCGANGKMIVTDTWQIFSRKQQICVTDKAEHAISCADATNCDSQIADVIFILDASGSMKDYFHTVKKATEELINALNVGQEKVRVGIISFAETVSVNVALGSIPDKAKLLAALRAIVRDESIDGKSMTDKALLKANTVFTAQSRIGVAKHVFVVTDGMSDDTKATLQAAERLKNAGVTIYAIAAGVDITGPTQPGVLAELRGLSAPESHQNMAMVERISDFQNWAKAYARSLCLYLSEPNRKMCDEGVDIQSISECLTNLANSVQIFTRAKYSYDSTRQCVKVPQSVTYGYCRKKCTDPVQGNEHFARESWTSLCHEFHCNHLDTKSPLRHTISSCLAADGTCKKVGESGFRCRDLDGKEVGNCRCISSGGQSALLLEIE